MLATASFAPPPNSASSNDRLESGLRIWVAAARAQLNQAVPSTDLLGNVMNEGIHLHAVSARLLEAAECAGQLAVNTAAGARGPLRTAMQEMGQAERRWGSVTTAMPPSHEYVEAARELQAALTDGRLFVTRAGRAGVPLPPPFTKPLSMGTTYRVWDIARTAALSEAEYASPLAKRPYDLRHAAVSLWLNAGVPPTQVAEWAGHSVNVLLRVYAKCV